MKWSELKDKPVVTVAGGEKLGFVDDLFVDEAGRTIMGVRTRSAGLITRHAAMLWSSINAVGEDAVTVRDASALNDEASFADLKDARRAQTIVGTVVMTTGGQEVGKIADLYLDLPSRTIVQYSLGVGLLDRIRGEERLIPVDAVRTLGSDAIVVDDGVLTGSV